MQLNKIKLHSCTTFASAQSQITLDDDYNVPDYRPDIVKVLKESDADIVASNYTWINHTTRMPEKRQEHPFEKIEYNKLYQFEEIVGKTIIDMHATTVKTELFRKADEQIDEHTFYVDNIFCWIRINL